MEAKDFSKLSEQEARSLIAGKLENKMGAAKSEVPVLTEKIYSYYKRLDVFPKSESLLDVSLKAMLKNLQRQQPQF